MHIPRGDLRQETDSILRSAEGKAVRLLTQSQEREHRSDYNNQPDNVDDGIHIYLLAIEETAAFVPTFPPPFLINRERKEAHWSAPR